MPYQGNLRKASPKLILSLAACGVIIFLYSQQYVSIPLVPTSLVNIDNSASLPEKLPNNLKNEPSTYDARIQNEPFTSSIVKFDQASVKSAPSDRVTNPAPPENTQGADIPRRRDVFLSPLVIDDNDNRDDSNHAVNPVYSRREKLVVKDPGSKPVVARTMSIINPCKDGPDDCFEPENYRPGPLHGCGSYNNCYIASDWREADVLVFYPFRIRTHHRLPNFTRPAGQRWVMFTPEAASRAGDFVVLNSTQFLGQFNWSLTYDLDSDIPQPYGKLRRLTSPPAKDYAGLYANKTVPAAWFVSHCLTQSLRMAYVRRMQKETEVHIYGSCGNYTCDRRQKDQVECFPMLSQRYFFYLAFENSFCKDYVTEKFFKIFTNADVIPVVRGATDYKRYFPPDTFIDASDFKTPEALGKYLTELLKDKDRYLNMLREKSRYEYVPIHGWPCKICEKMNADSSVQWYPGNNMWTWFVKDQCRNPTDL